MSTLSWGSIEGIIIKKPYYRTFEGTLCLQQLKKELSDTLANPRCPRDSAVGDGDAPDLMNAKSLAM